MNRLLPALLVAAALFGAAPQASAQALAPAKQWDKTFGGSGSEGISSLQPTSDGGYILGGSSDSPISGDKTQASRGRYDYWVVKLDANGIKQWDKTFGGTVSDYLSSLHPTSDGGYILGGYSVSGISGDKSQAGWGDYDYWVVKIDANGTKQWDKTFGGNREDMLQAVRQTSDGGYILAGSSESDVSGDRTHITPGAFDRDYWLVKLDANGTKQWDKSFGGRSAENLSALEPTSDGGYILGGVSMSSIGGDKSQPHLGAYDYWVVKINANGTKQWDRTLGGTSNDAFSALQQTSDGGYMLAGTSYSGIGGDKTQANQGPPSTVDYWVVKLDAAGTKQWDKTIGGNDHDYLYDLQTTSDGGYLLGGGSSSPISGDKTQASQGNRDYWAVKLDASGTKQWDKTLGGIGGDNIGSLRQTSDGGYIIGGDSSSGISGDKTQASQGGIDMWLVKLGAAPLATTAATTRPALSAYPNPTRTQLTLRGPLGTPYQLLNQLGQVVRAGQLSAQPLDVQALPAGLYLLRDQTTGRTTKLVKE